MKLLIYLPAFNEEENIQAVITCLPKSLDQISTIQYLVIDDGSTDRTREFALAAGASVISHDKNRGVGAAFHTAVQFALDNHADILVGMDADGQFDSLEIPTLMEPILANKADMVVGNRFTLGKPEYMPALKYWGNKQVAKLLRYVSEQKFQDVSCGFRALNREALLHLNLFGIFTYTHETILSLIYQGLRVFEHPIKVRYITARKSRVAGSIYKYALQTSKIIFRVILDYRPMHIFGGIAAVLFLIGSGFELFMFGHYALTGAYTPYKSFGFIGLGFVIFGALVFLMALIADMLNRMRMAQDKLLYEFRKLKYES